MSLLLFPCPFPTLGIGFPGHLQHVQTPPGFIAAVLQSPRGLCWASCCTFVPPAQEWGHQKGFRAMACPRYPALMDQWFRAFPKTTYKGALWFHTFISIREIKVNWVKYWMCSLCACSHLCFSTAGKVKSSNIYFQLWILHPFLQLVSYFCGAPKYMQQNCQSCSGLRCFRDFWGYCWNNL